MSHSAEHLAAVRQAVRKLAGTDLAEASRSLLGALGYRSPKTLDAPTRPADFLAALGVDATRFEALDRWRGVLFLFQLTGDELPALSRGGDPATAEAFQRSAIDSFVFLAIELDHDTWSRRQLVAIVRELNRGFSMPVILLFRHGGHATLAVIDRRANRRDAARDVVGGRISLIKDIDIASPHRAHVEILADLSLAALARRKAPADFRALYDLWLEALSAAELNKRFYEELADWFAWASTSAPVAFPKGQGSGAGAKEIALIRLLTRLMFVWFIKEKGLVPDALFDPTALARLLNQAPADAPGGHTYYLAILQNLFFATLNTEMTERRWRQDEGGQSRDYLGHHVFRHRALFQDPAQALTAFDQVPFLNGGLFECLDAEIAADDPRRGLADRERGRLVLRIDGFSDQEANQPRLPNALFFGGAKGVDLSKWFEKAKTPRSVPGLIDLFQRYKFTVEENTPLEEEAALDPELLGKVFENLLASYNEDTRTTARNKSGSFYTPREVVDFMVDEALVAWLLPKLPRELDLKPTRPRTEMLNLGPAPGDLPLERSVGAPTEPSGEDEARLRALLSFASRGHDFTPRQVDALIAAIESMKAIDPAVGSGAFPLGLLQKLVHMLDLLDPGGEKWRARNRLYYERRVAEAEAIPAAAERAEEMKRAEAALAEFDAKFEGGHYPDYTRKLFLIERCLHGVDIQPIAVQIAKLRCFISLAVEQRVDDARPNRGITPLPNLEAKFVAANTLTPLHRKGQAGLVTEALGVKERALREANRAFFAAPSGRSKRAEQKKIQALRKEIAEEVTRDHAFSGDDAAKLAAWDPFDPNAFAPFFDGEWMFGLDASGGEGWFDIAFANPPYIRQEKIEAFRINGLPVVSKDQLKADYKDTFVGTADIYVYFYERALRLLKPEGALAFITSNKWYRAGYGGKLRDWLSRSARILKIVDFGDAPVFEAIAYPTILVGTRRKVPVKPGPKDLIRSLNWTPTDSEEPKEAVKAFPERFAAEAFDMPQAELAASGWQLEPQAERHLLTRIRAGGRTLSEWCEGRFYYGIKTGLNEAFVIDGAKRLELIASDPKSAEIIKPFLRGRDVKRWEVQSADKWLIFTRQGTDISRYPAIVRHLEIFRAQLEPKPRNWSEKEDGVWGGRKGGPYKWFEIQDTVAYWESFERPKIIVPEITNSNNFAFDGKKFYCVNKMSIIPSENWGFLLGVLNSRISLWVAEATFTTKQGGFFEFTQQFVGRLPIPNADEASQQMIALAVRAITEGAERLRLEALINAFVYELFFAEDLRARNLRPFAAAEAAGLMKLAGLEGPALARATDDWSRQIADPSSQLYATIFDLQSLDVVRIIEGRG
jgi:hypothetical protein